MFRLVILSASLLLAGCESNRVYEVNHDFTLGNWASKDTLTFDFLIENPNQKYNVILNSRNSIDFGTVRLFTQYQLLDSSTSVLRSRLIEQNLFDKITGKPLGESGIGDIYEHHVLLEPSISFPAKGHYKVKLTHMMRADTLKEILSVGIRVENVQ